MQLVLVQKERQFTMPINNAAAAFIGASVTLVLVIIFMILMVILVRQCLAFLAKRSAIREQVEIQRQAREEYERNRRVSVTEPVPATFDWHHSIRIAGTPPPTYHEAKKLPAFEEAIVADMKQKRDTDGKVQGESPELATSYVFFSECESPDAARGQEVRVSIIEVNNCNSQIRNDTHEQSHDTEGTSDGDIQINMEDVDA